LIDKWFFIRYVDPDFHLRLRLHLKAKDSYGEVARLCLHFFQPGLESGLLWKLQADTYFRELERYGENEILIAENIFCYDSRLKLQFLLQTEGDERENLRWQWGMRGVDELLDAMGYILEKKYELLQIFQTTFAAEFAADNAFFKQVNSVYNNSRKTIELIMEKPVTDNNPFKPILDLYINTGEELKGIVSSLAVSVGRMGSISDTDRWIGSYIHMNLNRLFLSEPRLHELVLYDFLCTWYRSSINRMKKRTS
jgi:thiopeptide-type bacteriocin biosynthesis protein